MTRAPLPQRRACDTFNINFWNGTFAVTVGYYSDHLTPGEVFISGTKSGVDLDGVVRDSAVLLSLALQHGVAIETMQRAVTRNQDGSPSTIVGAICDVLVAKKAGNSLIDAPEVTANSPEQPGEPSCS